MATTTGRPPAPVSQEFIAGRRRRQFNETLLGWLFVLPAATVTFLFGIWPVIFGFFISTHQWRARTQSFLGLDQYVRAIGNIAYVLILFVCLLFVLAGARALRSGLKEMREERGSFFTLLPPALGISAGLLLLAAGLLFQTTAATAEHALYFVSGGLILLAASLAALWWVSRQSPTRSSGKQIMAALQLTLFWLLAGGLFIFTVLEVVSAYELPFLVLRLAFPEVYVPPLTAQIAAAVALALSGSGIYLARRWKSRLLEQDEYSPLAAWLRAASWILTALALLLAVYLIAALNYDRAAAGAVSLLERGEVRDLGMEATGITDRDAFSEIYGSLNGVQLANTFLTLPHVLSVLVGVLLLFLAYRVWRRAVRAETTMRGGTFAVIALLMAVGGWLFIAELPQALAVGDPAYFQALLTTVAYSIGTVPIQLTMGLLLAYILFYEIGLGKSLYRMIYFMPYIAPTVATATVFVIIFSQRPSSLGNQVLGALSIPPQGWTAEAKGVFQIIAELVAGPEARLPDFLVGPSMALASIILYNIWVFSGYYAVIYLAGLGAIPGELYEAAKVDGAGRWQAFRNITFPLLSPTTFFLTILGIAGTFQAFSHIYVLRHPGARDMADTASVHIFVQFWQFNQWGYAAAMAFVLFGIVLVLTLVQNELSRERVFYG